MGFIERSLLSLNPPESLRCEIAGNGIGVTVLYPGPLLTSLVRTGVSDSEQKRHREEKFLHDRGLSPEHAARLSLRRMLANPRRIVIGLDYPLLDLMVRISPRLAGYTNVRRLRTSRFLSGSRKGEHRSFTNA
jgi:short-subunit dehydrogenase